MSDDNFTLSGRRIWVAGHRGMVGSALVRRLAREGCTVLTASRQDLDLTDQAAVNAWMATNKPEGVFLAAAKVGGIVANNILRAEFIYENLAISSNVIHAAHKTGVKKLMYFGSTCVYPRAAPQPMSEAYFMTGALEPTNEPYAVAKIAGIKMAEAYRSQYGSNFISVMPTNLCGPGDNYHPEHSHVVAALVRRFHEAKLRATPEVVVWGTGTPRREFLFVDDLADACVFLMQRYAEPDIINIGTGEDISIADFARVVGDIVGYNGRIVFDTSKPDGMPRKLVDVSKINALGWKATTSLEAALRSAYADFLAQGAQST
jgi:GDP-L-fucose synthase